MAGSLRRTLTLHIVASTLYESSQQAALALLPLLARKQFGAGDWGTFLITVAIPASSLTAVQSEVLLARFGAKRFLTILWFAACLPFGLLALVQEYWGLFALYSLGAAGSAGWYPFKGRLFKQLYMDGVRGKALAVVNIGTQIGLAGWLLGLGFWLDRDPDAFRVYFPIVTVAQLAGLLLFARLAPHEAPAAATTALDWRAFVQPFFDMRTTLLRDPLFARYQLAFMTYGIGYMVCEALLPILADTKLHMSYGELASTTRVVWQFAIVLMALPMGWLLDRLGPARTTAGSFAWFALYPVFLMLAETSAGVALASVFFGMAMAGIQQGWMLGPVMLAPSADKVSQYVAIHTALVGFRGLAFQFLGMLIYTTTGSFAAPLAIAALALLAASAQMALLAPRIDRPRRAAPAGGEA